ncbi:alpha/beta fold hydrolase [Saccharothrix sp. NPDC042600]|uniref:alpha/beta fold hydrolase n=1 Tax=Saccharothrix TaxID=2071 RepID=UPI0033FF8EE4
MSDGSSVAGSPQQWVARSVVRDGARLFCRDWQGPGRPVSRAAYAADVIAVLDQLGLDRAVLVGQSLGGHTAMLAAAAHPDRVSGLVLVEAGPRGPQPDLPGAVGGWLASWPAPFPTVVLVGVGARVVPDRARRGPVRGDAAGGDRRVRRRTPLTAVIGAGWVRPRRAARPPRAR